VGVAAEERSFTTFFVISISSIGKLFLIQIK
jgi:hypothetical protein